MRYINFSAMATSPNLRPFNINWKLRFLNVTLWVDMIETCRPEHIQAYERNLRSFQAMLPELRRTHLGKVVAIHNNVVVDADPDRAALMARVFPRIPRGESVIFQPVLANAVYPEIRLPGVRCS